jgi:hypothetical protein
MNQKISELLGVLGKIDPISQGAGTAVSGWLPASLYQKLALLAQVGVFGGSATFNGKFQQATDSAGTGAKDISPAKAFTQIAAGTNNIVAILDLDPQELDVANGFCYVQASITVGVAATLISGLVVGADARNAPASANNPVSVVQVTG